MILEHTPAQFWSFIRTHRAVHGGPVVQHAGVGVPQALATVKHLRTDSPHSQRQLTTLRARRRAYKLCCDPEAPAIMGNELETAVSSTARPPRGRWKTTRLSTRSPSSAAASSVHAGRWRRRSAWLRLMSRWRHGWIRCRSAAAYAATAPASPAPPLTGDAALNQRVDLQRKCV
jgi:hypothetical protein